MAQFILKVIKSVKIKRRREPARVQMQVNKKAKREQLKEK